MRYPMPTLAILLLLCLYAGSANAQCLEVREKQIDEDRSDTSAAALAWRADIENSCERAYDADLTVHFTDGEGESVYEVRKLITIERETVTEAGDRQYLPAIYLSEIEGIAIDIVERKRPY
ncbi:MAG: hypothetical protein HUJ28_11205 [Chromatiales bacterium]|nr:hypothetical protein [Chromatiales bacterium]